jgi:hypothetical protein
MTQKEMTETALHRKDITWWRRLVLWYFGGSWPAAIVFFLVSLPVNALLISSGLGGGASLLFIGFFWFPLVIKVFKKLAPFMR